MPATDDLPALGSGAYNPLVPIYEYRCEDCNHAFEKLLLAGTTESALCPQCGGERASRVASTFGMIRGGNGASAEPMSSNGGSCCAGGGCTCHP